MSPEASLYQSTAGTLLLSGDLSASVNLNIEMTPELFTLLNELTKETGFPRGDVIRNALVLLDLAVDAVRSGGTVTIEAIGPDGVLHPQKVTGIVAPGTLSLQAQPGVLRAGVKSGNP